MNEFGTKLSRHVLGMKFMRRTKDQVEKVRTESKFRRHFGPGSNQHSEQEQISTSKSCLIEEVGSYSQVEGHSFGRQSFGGFNPVVETNVRNGTWRPFHLHPGTTEPTLPKEDQDQEEDQDDEVDVSDGEMAEAKKSYGSLLGTLGKKFLRKRDRSKKIKLDPDVPDLKQTGDKGQGGRKGWKKFLGGASAGSSTSKIKEEQTSPKNPKNCKNSPPSSNSNSKKSNRNKRRQSQDFETSGGGRGPKNKRMKFMKPVG